MPSGTLRVGRGGFPFFSLVFGPGVLLGWDLIFLQLKTDLDRYLPLPNAVIIDRASGLDNLEPAHLAHRLGCPFQCVLNSILNAFAGAAC
jgi:hypothetical protein